VGILEGEMVDVEDQLEALEEDQMVTQLLEEDQMVTQLLEEDQMAIQGQEGELTVLEMLEEDQMDLVVQEEDQMGIQPLEEDQMGILHLEADQEEILEEDPMVTAVQDQKVLETLAEGRVAVQMDVEQLEDLLTLEVGLMVMVAMGIQDKDMDRETPEQLLVGTLEDSQ